MGPRSHSVSRVDRLFLLGKLSITNTEVEGLEAAIRWGVQLDLVQQDHRKTIPR
jgi:hypothetical protein